MLGGLLFFFSARENDQIKMEILTEGDKEEHIDNEGNVLDLAIGYFSNR